MSDSNNEQLRPPPDWDKFEEICADLFSRIWDDPLVVRYGTRGQAQNGVDIYGKNDGADSGVQCKGKRDWPPTKLTIAEIEGEVEKAKAFRPTLKSFIIVTTAENDTRTTDRANAITAEHEKHGLFRVTVYGWRELVRRLNDHPDLLKKHFSSFTLRRLEESMPDAVANRVIERLSEAKTSINPSEREQAPPTQPSALSERLADALERDFSARYDRTLQRSMYPELDKNDEFAALAADVLAAPPGSPSPGLRRQILLRASRAASIKGRIEDATRLLTAGQSFSGETSDLSARARLAAAQGRPNQAIQLLRDETDPDARAVLLSIVIVERRDDEALRWFNESGLSLSQFAAPAIHTLALLYLRRSDFDGVNRVLDQATAAHLTQSPYLYFLRGAMRFARLLPKPEQATALSGLPLQVHHARPIVSDAELSAQLDEAINDLRQALPLASNLGLRFAPRVIESYILWCELLHPPRKDTALAKLRRDMADPALAVSRVQYALAYDNDYSPDNLETYLQRRDSFGGLTDEELHAKFAILLHKNDAVGLAALIAAKRQQAEALFGKDEVLSLEIHALAKKGDATSAAIVLENSLMAFDSNRIAMLRAEIAKAQGADPVAEHLRLYEATNTPESLRALVAALLAKEDYIGIAKYAELLFAETNDPRDLAFAAKAALHAGDGDTFVRLVEAHPGLQDRDADMLRSYGWQLFRLGRLQEARVVTDEMQYRYSAARDLSLEYAIALDSGDWERLAEPLCAALEPARGLDGLALIRAAHLSQASGQGPLMDLVMAAVAKGEHDPHVLLGAYHLFIEEGLEEQRPEAGEWFRKALALSGPDGPVQSFELKDLLSQQIQWNEHSANISQNLMRGDLPLVIAGPGLRTSVVDIILRSLVHNTTADGRRRTAIPLFTGRRLPQSVGAPASIALDITALLVLGWLGLLPKVLDTFPKVILPAGVLIELFEGRKRIRQSQKTRLQKAVEVREAIANGRIRVLRTPSLARDPVSSEIGVELAALLREAQSANGIVIRPAPVNKLGLEERAEANMSTYAACLCDMHGLLKMLAELNVVDEEAESSAKRYFDLQDRAWPQAAVPDPARPVFLDGLALAYLQHTKLLQTFLRTFPTVYIHVSTQDEANVLIEYDQNVGEVLRIIDDIRNAVRQAHSGGRVVFGPRRSDSDNEGDGPQSTFNLLSNLSGAEIAVFDDRALNKEPFVADSTGQRARICSTLDLLEEFTQLGLLTEDQYRHLRYRLRSAGALLIPVNADEIVAAAMRNRQNEAPEFRAIRDALELARLAETPQFPAEMPWLLSYVHAVKTAIARIWKNEPSEDRARILASQALGLDPAPENWVGRWNGRPPPNWVAAVRRALIGGLALPVEITDRSKIDAYQAWLEGTVMRDIRKLSPDMYEQVVNYLREFILTPWSHDGTD
ncbi:tetratricopeptide repeat protein [Bradyrhizobium sp. STM 3566]|uniref:tetratricopeptide repeat protein n=1 Tax=Bradyrhizobium sp. STM 3566 TaxID=578928 RepID=UPI00388DE854